MSNKESLEFKKISAKMERRKVKAPSGRKVLDCGDPVAEAFAGRSEKDMVHLLNKLFHEAVALGEMAMQKADLHTEEAFKKFAEELAAAGLLSTRTAFRAYKDLNLGMRRMNIGNRVRGCLGRAGVNSKLTKMILEGVTR